MTTYISSYGSALLIILSFVVFGLSMFCMGRLNEREKRLRMAEDEKRRQRAAELDRYAQESREFRLYSKRQFERESG